MVPLTQNKITDRIESLIFGQLKILFLLDAVSLTDNREDFCLFYRIDSKSASS